MIAVPRDRKVTRDAATAAAPVMQSVSESASSDADDGAAAPVSVIQNDANTGADTATAGKTDAEIAAASGLHQVRRYAMLQASDIPASPPLVSPLPKSERTTLPVDREMTMEVRLPSSVEFDDDTSLGSASISVESP